VNKNGFVKKFPGKGCLNEYRKGWSRAQAAGLSEREDALHPAVALFTGSTLTAFAPENCEAQGSLSTVIGGINPMHLQGYPKRIHLSEQPPGKRSRL